MTGQGPSKRRQSTRVNNTPQRRVSPSMRTNASAHGSNNPRTAIGRTQTSPSTRNRGATSQRSARTTSTSPRSSSDRVRVSADMATSRSSRTTQRTSRASHAANTRKTRSTGAPVHTHAQKVSHRNPFVAFFSGIGSAVVWLWSKSRIVTTILFVLIALLIMLAINIALTSGKILNGVHVGEVDVSDMTVPEATDAIMDAYEPKLAATTVYIFADEETANSEDLDLTILESDSLAEQLSFEEAQKNKKLWITSAEDLEASLPAEELAQRAFKAGRDEGVIARITAPFTRRDVDVYATFNEMSLSNLISDINATLGYETHDFGVKIEDGRAEVTEGNDGYMLDNVQFSNELSDSLLADESPIVGFVANVQYTPMKITREAAEATCDALNTLVPQTITFTNKNKDTEVWHDTILGWVRTETAEEPRAEDGNADAAPTYYPAPYIDIDTASNDLISFIEQGSTENSVKVSYIFEDSDVFVQPESDVAIPKVDESLSSLDAQLFDNFRSTLEASGEAQVHPIDITTEHSSARLPLSDAIAYGVVDVISSFTTKYTNTSATAGRTFNVHHAADLLNNSIAPGGGEWSFNEIVGPCDADHGFKEANVIEAGEYTTGIGGGICQVATTVFNAAYEGGLPIKERRNHSLHSSSYPAGRDAAIAYPNSDLVWANDTDADILLRTTYTDTSLTVTLIGTDPEREVETVTGEWVDGKKHGLKFEVDEDMAPNASYIKTAGTDGMEITVTRTVKDRDGNTISTDDFVSSYAPITKVVVCGANSDMNALREKYEDKDDE